MKNVELPKIPDKLNDTEKKLAEMFMERVPTNLLDSGLIYGYGFDYNREHPVWEQPESHVEFGVFSDGTLDIALWLNTYKLLASQLDYDEEADQKFQEWLQHWYEKDESWEAHLDELPALSESDNAPDTWISEYTYNVGTLLDQQIVYWWCQGSGYVILEVHNGCDARCGFTEPVLFRVEFYNDFDPYAFGTIRCPECGSWWDYECTGFPLDRSEEAEEDLKDYPAEKGEEGKKGIVVVNEKYEAFCPVCGKGKLE